LERSASLSIVRIAAATSVFEDSRTDEMRSASAIWARRKAPESGSG
jgi:hypothetical protein